MNLKEVRLEGAPNFRDLGGARSIDGRRLRHGRLYRSEILTRVSDADLDVLQALRITAVCDLRHGVERTRQLNRWPAGSSPQIIGVEPSEGMEAVQANGVQSRIVDPDFDPEEGRALLVAGYRLMPRTLAPALRAVLQHLTQAQDTSLLIHCTSGKDRSGFVCAMLLTALGISPEDVLRDYLLSRDRYPVDHTREALRRALGDALPPGRMELLLELTTVSPAYLAGAFDQIDAEYGGVDAYLRDVAGLGDEARVRLQSALLA